jgi:hypothetical protein
VTGSFSIQLDTTQNWPARYNIYLVDSLLKKEVNLQKEAYHFNVAQTGSQTQRFWLVVNNWSIGQAEDQAAQNQEPWAYQNESGLWLELPKNGYRLKEYSLLSLDGRVVYQANNVPHQERYRLDIAKFGQGVYIIETESNSGVFNRTKIKID